MTTDGRGRLTPLTPKFKEINSVFFSVTKGLNNVVSFRVNLLNGYKLMLVLIL